MTCPSIDPASPDPSRQPERVTPDAGFRLHLRRRPVDAPRADVTAHEVAAVTGLTDEGVRALAASGRLVPTAAGPPMTFDVEAIAAYIKASVRRHDLALWALEQIVLNELAAPVQLDQNGSLAWALEAFMRAISGR
jgi:hypothetical protein